MNFKVDSKVARQTTIAFFSHLNSRFNQEVLICEFRLTLSFSSMLEKGTSDFLSGMISA